MTSPQFRPGDIVLVDLNKSASSIIISKKRPAIIISNNDITRTSSLLQVIPLTTSDKHFVPTHVKFKRNDKQNTALCEQVTTVHVKDIEPTNDWVTGIILNKIKNRLKIVFDIN